MKFWNINKDDNLFLIVSEHTLGVIKYDSEEELQKLINENKASQLNTFSLSTIKEAIFNHTDRSIEITFKGDVNDLDLYKIDSKVYDDIKSFFIANISGVDIKDYTMLKQVKFPIIGMVVFTFFTWLFYNTALAIENGETVSVSGRRGFIKKIFVWIADLLGTTGSLIIGGLLIALFVYATVSAIAKPKQGNVFKFKKTPKLNIK